jgi:hypothetical protein
MLVGNRKKKGKSRADKVEKKAPGYDSSRTDKIEKDALRPDSLCLIGRRNEGREIWRTIYKFVSMA